MQRQQNEKESKTTFQETKATLFLPQEQGEQADSAAARWKYRVE